MAIGLAGLRDRLHQQSIPIPVPLADFSPAEAQTDEDCTRDHAGDGACQICFIEERNGDQRRAEQDVDIADVHLAR
jgi:hypothetical protein